MMIFGTYFFIVGYQAYALLAYALAGSLVAFLIFNHHPAKIFMGDSGSLLIGLVNAILVIKFINVASDPAVVVPVDSAVAIGFSILIVPLLDTLRVFAIRIFNGTFSLYSRQKSYPSFIAEQGFWSCRGNICMSWNKYRFCTTGIFWPFIWFHLPASHNDSIAFTGFALLYYRKPRRTLVIAKRHGWCS